MRYSIWHDWAKVPMDVMASMHLTNANGGISQLHRLVPEMTFQIGIVDCKTSFWISDNCPPEILLGRPWQIENKVTIAEKDDGTHLVLMDQKYDPKFSILLRPNQLSRSAMSHLIQQVDSSLADTTTCVSMTAVTAHCATASLTLLVPTQLGILWPRAIIPVCAMSVENDTYSSVLTNVFSNKSSNLPQERYKYEGETKLICRKGTRMALLANLRNSYSTIFQPDPCIPEYNTLQPGLHPDHIGEDKSLIHAPISNLVATYLALNASQLVGLQSKIQHVASDHFLCYVI